MHVNCEVSSMDFEKVIFGLHRIFSNFTMGKWSRVIADYNPEVPKIHLSFLEKSESGELVEKTWGHICRQACERVALIVGQKVLEKFKIGEQQRIISEYDPQVGSTLIEVHDDLDIRSLGSAGTSEVIGSEESQTIS